MTTSRLGRLTNAVSQSATARGIYLGRRSTGLHVALYRLSGGRLGGRVPGWPTARMLLLEHTGARTGTRRTSPLVYIEDGDALAIVASKGGQPTNPHWLHNLVANPDTRVHVGSKTLEVRARVADGSERERLWEMFVAAFPGYEVYAKRAVDRTIPVVVLEPR